MNIFVGSVNKVKVKVGPNCEQMKGKDLTSTYEDNIALRMERPHFLSHFSNISNSFLEGLTLESLISLSW